MEYIIETKNLCKSYHKKAAVTSLNMHVRPGEIYGLAEMVLENLQL